MNNSTASMSVTGDSVNLAIHNVSREDFERFLPLFDKTPVSLGISYAGIITMKNVELALFYRFEGESVNLRNPFEEKIKEALDDEFIKSFPEPEEV